MRRICWNFIIICAIVISSGASAIQAYAGAKEDAEAQLETLDHEIVRREKYILNRHHRIDSLRQKLARMKNPTPREAALMRLKIGDSYTSLANDSALREYNHGRKLLLDAGVGESDSLLMMIQLRMATYMPLAGLTEKAERMFQQIDTASVPKSMLREYFDAGRQMYSYLATYFTEYPSLSQVYNNKSLEMQKKLLEHFSPNEIAYHLNKGEILLAQNQLEGARRELEYIIKSEPIHSNFFARASHHLATIALRNNDADRFVYHLARSAISDIQSGTLEVTSLQDLGEYLFKQDDTERSYIYLSAALSNAVECNATMRVIESSRSLPLIERTHTLHLSQTQKRLEIIVWMLVVVAIALVASMAYLMHERHRESELRRSLKVANTVKEMYISQFLKLCSIYIDKMNQFCKLAHRKISAGKVDDLDKLVQSGKFMEENNREFYDVFDRAFLHIYPGFLAEVNRLLKPDQQIVLGDDEQMNNELRILAFMRLGIHESSRIAQMLNYSVNTIYTYRNRLKTKALNRDTFEQEVMAIGT